MINLRPANQDHDIPVIQSLYESFYPAPVPDLSTILTTQSVRVAESLEGSVVGFRVLSPTYFLWIAVVAEYQRKGIGTLLMNDALEQAAELGASTVMSRIKETQLAGRALCARFGFESYLHMVNLELDLNTWDDSAISPALGDMTAAGIAFSTYADEGNTETNQQRLYALNKALSATVPRDEPQPFMEFNTYVQRQLARESCPHNGIYLALHGDQWIGMSQVSLHDGFAFIEMTGVLPEYRGRGIAQALKLMTIQFARQNDRRIVKTFNDVSNAPMIAVNEKMGFKRGEAFYQVRRTLG